MREYRGMTLMELARESLETTGASTRGLSSDEVATRALHSTLDFPEILPDFGAFETHDAYVAWLEDEHGRKFGFWSLTAA